MRFASIRIIAKDINALVGFYEDVTGIKADWLAPVFAEIVTSNGAIAFGTPETVSLFKEGSAEPEMNHTVIVELQVNDIDAEYDRLKDVGEIVHAPKLLPWGNKTLQMRDPEGTLVSLYMPATDAAKTRFSR